MSVYSMFLARRAGFTLFAAFLCMTPLGAAPMQGVKLPPCAVPPVIDGALNDASWKSAASVDEFFTIGKSERVKKHRAWLTFDNAWLYVAFEVNQGEMERLAPRYINGHDDFVQRDDCVKLSFDPGGKAGPWYHFKLNRVNIRQDRRIQASGSQEIQAWNIPWKSAVNNTATNWTVEMAVPLCLLPPLDHLDKARLNLVITTFIPKRDAQGVVVEAPARTDFSLSPVTGSWFEPEKFVSAGGLEKLSVKAPFLPYADKVCIAPYFEKKNAYCYGIDMELGNLGEQGGKVKFLLEDRPAVGPSAVTEDIQDLPAHRPAPPYRLGVPVASMERRSAVLRVLDPTTGEEWQRIAFAGEATRALDLLGGYLDRNYYTSENEATAILTVRLPESMLAKLTLTAENSTGKALAQIEAVKPDTIFRIPLAALPIGKNAIKLKLRDERKREMSSLALDLVKRAPLPGREWKVDKVNRVLLNNGKPFFAMGFCVEYLLTNDVITLKKLKEGGFNFLQLWVKYDAAGMADYARKIEQEGLHVMPVPDDAAAAFRGEYTLKHPKFSWCKPTLVTYLKCNLCGGVGTRSERNAAFQEYLDWLMPDILGIVEAAKTSPANLGYFIFDEPQIEIFDQGIIGKALYDRINERDGYHPVLVNYSSEIPDAEQAVNWMDILCTDPYWVPAAPSQGLRGTVNFVSMIAARTHAMGEPGRLVSWSIPMCNTWSACVKRGANREEQFCQTYLAAIHGASGIMYFVLQSVQGDQAAWEAASAVARQFADVLGAACVAPGVKHAIAYAQRSDEKSTVPIVHDPANGKFADIQMAVKRDPKGGYILMAANSRPYPVGCEITIKGMKAPKIGRYFATDEYAAKDGRFTDTFEAYGVRAYRLPECPEPVELGVVAVPPKTIPEPESSITWHAGKKNKMPNPSFEEVSLPGGLPDYSGSGNKGNWNRTVFIDKQVFKFGRQSVRLDGGYIQPTCVPPQAPGIPGKYVFSVWLKGSKDGSVEIKDLGQYVFLTNVTVGTDWKRLEFPFTMKRADRLIFTISGLHKASLWVDGMQLEKGDKATDFEE